jgi:hypothetical protein
MSPIGNALALLLSIVKLTDGELNLIANISNWCFPNALGNKSTTKVSQLTTVNALAVENLSNIDFTAYSPKKDFY